MIQTITLPEWIYLYRNIAASDPAPREKISTYIFERMVTTPEGGLYAFYTGALFPEKFATVPHAMGALNIVKGLTMVLTGTIPWRGLQTFLLSYCKMCDRVLAPWYLRPELNCTAVRELKFMIFSFLRMLGVTSDTAFSTARIIATIFEYDVAYRYRLQDIATETYQGKLITQPRKEINRLLKLYLKRETAFDYGGKTGAGDRIRLFMKIFSFALFIPRIRRAAIATLANSNFYQLQFDTADRYHCMLRDDYHFFGLTFEQRLENYKLIHPDGLPPTIILGE